MPDIFHSYYYIPADKIICGNCLHWIPNGGPLLFGYCSKKSMSYRRYNQPCKGNYGTKSYTFEFNPYYYYY